MPAHANTFTMPPASSPSSEKSAAWGIVVLVIATVLLGALLPSRQLAPVRQAAEDATCLEWSDGCRVCRRLAEGPACSLPGIACTPGETRCLRRGGP